MRLHFYKYQGTGNDFVIFDNRENKIQLTRKQVAFLCDRRFGVGADGLMLLNPHPQYDFEMKYYNADGRESTMCGNGGRCLVKFADETGILKSQYHFIAVDGEHEARIEANGNVALKMNDVSDVQSRYNKYVLNTGSPHYVEIVENVMGLDVYHAGRAVRYNDEFKNEGVNVNFVQQTGEPDKIIVRTYERGVEDETYSCGTGVTASALVNYHNENGYNYVCVQTKGGMLNVEFDKTENGFKNIWLIGPATKVFEGEIEISDF
ncbi:diaminopimelate epimerase [Flavisolibacter ginsenosidimutans]|uniref:Diaminopimelate epimerase n=1 Tax=Flavisolibacter ginsenosidimutans TaxID=661481 RepID=A0A5B8UEG7_9BACT|nr:diaminopimelate epimerase [Flavisolibacter ginsenosidimutans]QEC55071.1 diaminopimelate epimerase [Flavisolibacter ginsenosidimutans]